MTKLKKVGAVRVTSTPEEIKARIFALDAKTMEKMGVEEFFFLRKEADEDGRKKLDYLIRKMEIENFARGIAREEIAKAKLR